MIFDISNEKSSKKFLAEFLDIDEKLIDYYIEGATDAYFLDEFLEKVDRSVEDKSINNLSIAALHMTSNNDQCRSIKELGILNLNQVLSMETPISRFLKDYGISFDISNNLMFIKDKILELKFDYLREEIDSAKGKINNLARKIYSDNETKAYFCFRESKTYEAKTNLRPEIIYDLSMLSKNPEEFEDKWISNNEAYMVKFILPMEYFAYYSFYQGIDAYKEDYSKKSELKQWLVIKALGVIWEKYHYGKLPKEITAYLKPEVIVSPKSILDIRRL